MSIMMKSLRAAVAVLATGLLLASCATGHADQDKLRGYPYQPFSSVKQGNTNNYIDLPLMGLETVASEDKAYPDLYVFADRNMSENLFKQVVRQFPQLGKLEGKVNAAGLDSGYLEGLREILVFRPSTGSTLQAILIGNYPLEITRAVMLGSGYVQRYVNLDGHPSAFAMEKPGIHVGLVDTNCIIVQLEDKVGETNGARIKNFDLFARRVIRMQDNTYTPILQRLSETASADKSLEKARSDSLAIDENGDPIKEAVPPASLDSAGVRSFDTVLVKEVTRPALFALASFALPASSPASAVRVRVEPLDKPKNGEAQKFGVELSFRGRNQETIGDFAGSLQKTLANLAAMAGLEASVLDGIKFQVRGRELIMTGLALGEDAAVSFFGELVKQGENLWNQTASGQAQPAPQ